MQDIDTNDQKVFIKGAKNISSKQALLIIPITKFFTNEYNLKKLISILSGESIISLRLVDWFVTNYCKKFDIMYDKLHYNALRHGEPSDNIPKSFDNMIIVHSNYKSQLKECSKKQFDPFCRRNRVRFYYEPGKYFITTVGQLNFFKWAIENYIVDYIEENFKDIEDDMNTKINSNNIMSNITNISNISNNDNIITNPNNPNNTNNPQLTTVITTKKRGAPKKCILNIANSTNSTNSATTTQPITTATITAITNNNNNTNNNINIASDNINLSEINLQNLQNPQNLYDIGGLQSLKKFSTRKKKKELIVPNGRTMSRHNIPTILTFD